MKFNMNQSHRRFISFLVLSLILSSCGAGNNPTSPTAGSPSSTTSMQDDKDSRKRTASSSATEQMADLTDPTTLEILSGAEVFLKRKTDADFSKISEKLNVEAGDIIKVGEGSEAAIYWVDDSVTRIAEKSVVIVNTLELDPEDVTSTNIAFELMSGETWSKAMDIVSDKSSFSMRAGSAVAGVRGTSVQLSYQAPLATIRAVDHTVYIASNGEPVDISEGEQATIQPQNNGELKVERKPIPDELKNQPAFLKNVERDKEHETRVGEKMTARLEKKLSTGPTLDELQNKLNAATDPEEKAQLLLQISQQNLQRSLLSYHQGNAQEGEKYWKRYENGLPEIKQALGNVSDPNFVQNARGQIAGNANLGLKYSGVLLPDRPEMGEQMGKIVLDHTTDQDRKNKLSEMQQTHQFFQNTDKFQEQFMKGANPSPGAQAEFKKMLSAPPGGQFQPFQCQTLTQMGQQANVDMKSLPAGCQPPPNNNTLLIQPPPAGTNIAMPNNGMPPPPNNNGSYLPPPPPNYNGGNLPPPPPPNMNGAQLPPPPNYNGGSLPPPPGTNPPPPNYNSTNLPPPPNYNGGNLPPPPPPNGNGSYLPPPPNLNGSNLPPPPPNGNGSYLPPPPPPNGSNLPPPPNGNGSTLPPPNTNGSYLPPPPPPPNGNGSYLPPPPNTNGTLYPSAPLQPPPPNMNGSSLPPPPNNNSTNLPPPPSTSGTYLPPPPPPSGSNILPPPP